MDQVHREEMMFAKEQITYRAEILSHDRFAVLCLCIFHFKEGLFIKPAGILDSQYILKKHQSLSRQRRSQLLCNKETDLYAA